jgi:hypothetical protein
MCKDRLLLHEIDINTRRLVQRNNQPFFNSIVLHYMWLFLSVFVEHLQQMLHFNNLAKYEGFRPPTDELF